MNVMLFVEMFTLHRAWTDLTDDELLWEPVSGSWSVRKRAECQTPTPFGQGDWVVDFDGDLVQAAAEGKVAEPLTTVAWLFWHIGSMPGRAVDLDFLGGSKKADTGWTSPYLTDHPVFSSADEAVTTVRDGWRALDRAIQASTDGELEQQTRFWGYPGHPGPPAPGYQILASILNEISHHATQVCMLRDLYRAVGGQTMPRRPGL